ncbi:hypothetical protein GCM10010317_016210 [Streptomyces mirabilis]|nr:hypothetical protein GCM10010317_016210 [Streptomyces mirabilis]
MLDDDQGVATEVADWSPVAADVEVASPSADRQTPDRAATRPTLENPTTAPGLTVLLGRISDHPGDRQRGSERPQGRATIFDIAPPPQRPRRYHAVALRRVTGLPGL